MTYIYLAFEFFKIGLFSVGGGMATLPFLLNLTKKYDWFTAAELSHMVAISESTPGPVGINMATYAGYQAGGVLGALVATLSLVAPAFLFILLIAKFLENFSEHPLVKASFYGIRPTVAALIGYAVFELIKISLLSNSSPSSILPWFLLILFFFLMEAKPFKTLHPLFWIVFGAGLGVVFGL